MQIQTKIRYGTSNCTQGLSMTFLGLKLYNLHVHVKSMKAIKDIRTKNEDKNSLRDVIHVVEYLCPSPTSLL